jgi:hypothetical protein
MIEPEILALVEALADRAAREYLASIAAANQDVGDSCTERAPLPDTSKAA